MGPLKTECCELQGLGKDSAKARSADFWAALASYFVSASAAGVFSLSKGSPGLFWFGLRGEPKRLAVEAHASTPKRKVVGSEPACGQLPKGPQ